MVSLAKIGLMIATAGHAGSISHTVEGILFIAERTANVHEGYELITDLIELTEKSKAALFAHTEDHELKKLYKKTRIEF